MQTSCPECRTAFRVSQDQLGLRRGLVRCGKCNAVFNAYDTLLAELEEPPAATLFSGEPARDALAATAPGVEPSPPPVDQAIPSIQDESAAPVLADEPADEPADAPAAQRIDDEAPPAAPISPPASDRSASTRRPSSAAIA